MFTGIVEGIGTVTAFSRRGSGAVAEIDAGPLAAGFRLGDSLAVDGACLTVTRLAGSRLSADLSAETLRRTTLGGLRPGSRVNLERPLRPADRLGGHLVTGHIDGVGRVEARTPAGSGELWRFRYPPALASLLAEKGSVAVDGISLTIAALGPATFEAALIPHTIRETALHAKRPGAAVNLEADLIGKYVARLARPEGRPAAGGGLTLELLQEHGFA